MTEIKLRHKDNDLLPLINKCSSDELDNLVGYITRKGGVSCQLKTTKAYKANYPDHAQYANEIAAEIQKFGGNTILNIMRKGKGAYYKDIVCDVAVHLKVKFNKEDDIDFIEQQILLKVLELSWEKMEHKEKEALLKGIMEDTSEADLSGDFPKTLITVALVTGGAVISYRLAFLVASAVARLTLERGISIAASTLLSRWVSIFAGAIGIGITAVWTAFDVAGPAFRVTIPCVLHIAMLRQLHRINDSGEDPDKLLIVNKEN